MFRTRQHDCVPLPRQRDGGYLLLAVMLMMALIIIAATVSAPRVVQQLKRDREEEMIHRGAEYARAIKKFFKKNGRYPTSLDELDKGEIRFLRKRFSDPLTKDGNWKILKYGDIQTLLNSMPGQNIGPGGERRTLTPGGASISGVPSPPSPTYNYSEAQPNLQPVSGGSSFPSNSNQGFNPEALPTTSGFGTDSSNGLSSLPTTTTQQGASSTSGGSNANNQAVASGNSGSPPGSQLPGGGAIVGVASLSKEPTIRIYNKKKTYSEWQFIYNPMIDQSNTLIKGPFQPTMIANTQVGAPAAQINTQPQDASSGLGQPH